MKTKTAESTRPASRAITTPRRATPVGAASASVTIDLVPALLHIKSILVPIDFSAPSQKALAYAVRFAEQFGARLTLLHVVEPMGTPDFVPSFSLLMDNDKVKAECKGRLERVTKEQAIDPRLIEKTLVRFGRSFTEIAEAASTLKVDLIVIATHGYTGLKHTLLGSTTERVVRHAPCPVLVVRQRGHEFV